MPDDANGVNIPITSEFDGTAFEELTQAGINAGARLRELQSEEAKASAPVAPPVSAPGADKATAALREVGNAGHEAGEKTVTALEKARVEADLFAEHLKSAVTFSAGAVGAELVLSTLESIREKIGEVIKEGIAYNGEVETSINSLASTLRSAEPEIYKTRDAAKGAAQDIFGQIRDFATSNGLDVKSTFEAYSANYNAFVEAGARDTQKQIEFVSTIIAAEASKGISGAQGLRDAIDLLQGRFERITFAKEIGATTEGFKEAAAQGKQLDYILSKVGGYKEGISDYANSYAGLSQQVHSLTEQLEGLLLKGSFGPLKEDLAGLVAILKDPGVAQGAENFGNGIGKIISFASHLGGDAATGAQKLEGAMNALFPKLSAVVELVQKLGEADPLQSQLATNAKLVDMATTQEQQARVRLALQKQLAAAVQDGNKDAIDGLHSQIAELDNNLGKHKLTADAAAATVKLTEDEKGALKDIGAALDANNLKEQDKATQLRAQQASLDDQIAKAAEYSGLQAGIVANIRTAADFQRETVGLDDKRKATLAEYLQGIIQTRGEVDKLQAAEDKQAEQRAKKIDGLNDALGTINDKLTDQRKKLADVEKSTDTDKPDKIKRIESNINALLDDQKKKREELAKATQQQADAAHPKEAADRDAAQKALDDDKLDPNRDYSEQEEQDRANRRAALQARINRDKGIISGQIPSDSPAPPTNPDGTPKDPDNPTVKVYPEEEGQRNLPPDGNTSPPPPPSADPSNAASSLSQAATANVTDATGKASDAAGKLADATGKLAPALDAVKNGFDQYHQTNVDGLNTLAGGINQNMNNLAGVVSGQTSQIAALQGTIAQMQLQIANLANS